MGFDQYMLNQAVPSDLDVEVLSIHENKGLYVARMRDVWHFVEATVKLQDKSENYHTTYLAKVTIPRYQMAVAVESLEVLNAYVREKGDVSLQATTLSVNGDLRLYSTGNREYYLAIHEELIKLPDSFVEILDKDVTCYKLSKTKIIKKEECYVLPRSKSQTKKPISAHSMELVNAVAFERELHKKLDAKKFGIYSAFCTWKDYMENSSEEYSIALSRKYIESFVDWQLKFKPEDDVYSPEFIEDINQIQDTLFLERFWGAGTKVSKNKAINLIEKGMNKLTTYQLAQFELMIGMNSAGFFIALAQILKMGSADDYIDPVFNYHGAHSQKLYKSIASDLAIIRMLGDLAHD
jgi:hypothetical protein